MPQEPGASQDEEERVLGWVDLLTLRTGAPKSPLRADGTGSFRTWGPRPLTLRTCRQFSCSAGAEDAAGAAAAFNSSARDGGGRSSSNSSSGGPESNPSTTTCQPPGAAAAGAAATGRPQAPQVEGLLQLSAFSDGRSDPFDRTRGAGEEEADEAHGEDSMFFVT